MEFEYFTNKGPHISPRGDNSKIKKYMENIFKKFYFKNTVPVSTKLGIKHTLVEEVNVF